MPNEAPNETDTNTTPVDGGNIDTTQAAADKAATTPTPEGGNQPDIDKIVKNRLDRERKKWEAERTEAEKRARMDEAERLKADLADRDKRIAEAKAEAAKERSLRNLKGKVVDEEDAYYAAQRLELVNEDGTIDVDALLKAKPYFASQPKPGAFSATGAPLPGNVKDPSRMSDEEYFRSRTQPKE